MPDLTDLQVDALLKEARRNRDKAYDFTRQNDEEARDDLKFVAGEQWHRADLDDRNNDGRPALTINQMPQFVRQVTGDIRLNRPSIKVRPVDSGADKEKADILSGLIRHIEYQSRALRAYVTAAESAARCGIGHFRIVTEFSDDSSFNQDIRIRSIRSPFAVSWDPASEEDDRSDAMWCFVVSEVDNETFKAQWPDASLSGWSKEDREWDETLWRTRDTVTVAEYWRKERKVRTLCLLESGETIDTTDFTDEQTALLPIVRKRTVDSHKVMQYLITDMEILEGPFEWIGKDIPIIPVLGEQVHIGERTVRHGMIRFAKDSQRQYNYWQTTATESMALAPKSPYLATQDQIEGYESMWNSANKKNYSVLMYKHDPQVPGPPVRNSPPEFPVAAANMMQTAAQDMHRTTGIYPPSLGAQGNETSGRAISLRQSEGDVGTYVYVENTAYAIETAGRQMVDIIPKVYDAERVVRILGEDDAETTLVLNQIVGQDDDGPIMANDITLGRYDVV
ncbi:MAG: portal protein, partial [Geminicoccaceae bacterium]